MKDKRRKGARDAPEGGAGELGALRQAEGFGFLMGEGWPGGVWGDQVCGCGCGGKRGGEGEAGAVEGWAERRDMGTQGEGGNSLRGAWTEVGG